VIGLNSCEHYLEMMSAFMDGELDESLRAELSEHISTCDECFNASLAYKAINEAISDGEVTPPEDLCALVMKKIHTSSPAAPKAKKKFTMRHLGALVAALAVVIVTAVAAPSMFKKAGSDEAANDAIEASPEDIKGSLQNTMLDGSIANDADQDDTADGGEVGTSDNKPGFLPTLPLYDEPSDPSYSVSPSYSGYDGIMMIGPRPGTADASDVPVEKEEDSAKEPLGDPVIINDYECSAIIVLDPAVSPPDVFEQYTYYSWVENQDVYHIVSADLYDELTGALENLSLSYTLDLFSELEKDGWVLLITAMKE